MLVSQWMTSRVITLAPNTLLISAVEIMRRERVRQLPVIDDFRKLKGILSDRDARDAMPSKYLSGEQDPGNELSTLTVERIMTRDPLTVSADTSMEVVGQMLRELRIGGLPVTSESGVLMGIVTEVDVFRFLAAITGADLGGVQFVFKTGGGLERETAILNHVRGLGLETLGFCVSTDPAGGDRCLSVRVASEDPIELDRATRDLKSRFNLVHQVRGEETVF